MRDHELTSNLNGIQELLRLRMKPHEATCLQILLLTDIRHLLQHIASKNGTGDCRHQAHD